MRVEKYLFIFLVILSYKLGVCQSMTINFNTANPSEIEIADIKKILVNETTFTITTNTNSNQIYNINDINSCVFSNIAWTEEYVDLKNISLYPNPFDNQFKIASNFSIETIKMFDFYNNEIEITISKKNNSTLLTIIPNPKLHKGLYFLIISAGGKNYSKIIQNF